MLLPGLAIHSPYQHNDFFGVGLDPFNLASMAQEDVVFSSAGIQDLVAQQTPNNTIRHITSDPGPTQARVDFAAKRLVQIPKTFASLGQAMFIHRASFLDSQGPTPPALQDALSACALYCLKTPMNKDLVFSNLEHKRQQLLTRTDHLAASQTDLLAALQALVLYQIIGLFDGDVRLRATAEADEHVVMTWATQLRARTPYALDPPCSTAEQGEGEGGEEARFRPQIAWRRWLIEESSRRTVITAFLLKGVYHFLKFGFDIAPDLRLSFVAQAALWHAQSEACWRRACGERELLLVQVPRWDEAMVRAQPADLEELGVLLMAMLKGVDATRDWLGQSYAVRYGVEAPELGLM